MKYRLLVFLLMVNPFVARASESKSCRDLPTVTWYPQIHAQGGVTLLLEKMPNLEIFRAGAGLTLEKGKVAEALAGWEPPQGLVESWPEWMGAPYSQDHLTEKVFDAVQRHAAQFLSQRKIFESLQKKLVTFGSHRRLIIFKEGSWDFKETSCFLWHDVEREVLDKLKAGSDLEALTFHEQVAFVSDGADSWLKLLYPDKVNIVGIEDKACIGLTDDYFEEGRNARHKVYAKMKTDLDLARSHGRNLGDFFEGKMESLRDALADEQRELFGSPYAKVVFFRAREAATVKNIDLFFRERLPAGEFEVALIFGDWHYFLQWYSGEEAVQRMVKLQIADGFTATRKIVLGTVVTGETLRAQKPKLKSVGKSKLFAKSSSRL